MRYLYRYFPIQYFVGQTDVFGDLVGIFSAPRLFHILAKTLKTVDHISTHNDNVTPYGVNEHDQYCLR